MDQALFNREHLKPIWVYTGNEREVHFKNVWVYLLSRVVKGKLGLQIARY